MGVEDHSAGTRRVLQAVLLFAATAALYAVSRANYLLFHALVESVAVVIAASVFVIAWSSRRYMENAYLLIVGVAYLFLGLLDLVHALAYPGMRVFASQTYAANQLWIAARYLEALALLFAFAYLPVRRRPNPYALLAVLGGATALVLLSIFAWGIFPVCFVEGVGQTPFKIASEFVIVALLTASLALVQLNRSRFAPGVGRAISASIALAIAAECAFMAYRGPYDVFNLVGHFLKLFSYLAIYVAIIETCLDSPYDFVFRELNTSNARLSNEITARRQSEAAKDEAISKLHAAIEEIRTLRGILPICAHCKKIRDDRGAWNQIEAYIQRHSEAQFSHGICPDCLDRYYGDIPRAGGDVPAAHE
jgi:hypothetical protein